MKKQKRDKPIQNTVPAWLTDKPLLPQSWKNSKLPPIQLTALSRDRGLSVFPVTKRRSLNTPEVRLAHEWLTHWLNGTMNTGPELPDGYRNTPESRERLLALLNAVRDQLESFREHQLPYYPNEKDELLQTVFLEIAKLMRPYATVPLLLYHPKTKRWGLGLQAADPGLRPEGEVMAAHGILELARSEALDRLRICDCDKWFFAKRKDGVACSDTCRKRIHDQKPEVKEKRQEKARNNLEIRSGNIYLRRGNG